MELPSKLKEFGAVLLILGTAVGAGILALPIPGSEGGIFGASLWLAVLASLMLYTALIVLEVTTSLPEYRNSFASMALMTMGKMGKVVVIVFTLLLLYALTAAYMAGMGSLLGGLGEKWGIKLSPRFFSIAFTVVFGLVVYLGTIAVDKVNQLFILLKILFLILAFVVLSGYLKGRVLFDYKFHPSFIVRAAPIFITAFGFHTTIPSITNYLGRSHYKALRRAILIGGGIPLFIYIGWIILTFGIIPQMGRESFMTIHQQGESIALLIEFLEKRIRSPFAKGMIDAFSNIAMITSFLGVSLGLFDFLADTCKRQNHSIGRLQTALITFVPPLTIALFFPQGFVLALNYAAIFVAVLLIIIPSIMVLRKRHLEIHSPYQVKGTTPLFLGVIASGLFVIFCALL